MNINLRSNSTRTLSNTKQSANWSDLKAEGIVTFNTFPKGPFSNKQVKIQPIHIFPKFPK